MKKNILLALVSNTIAVFQDKQKQDIKTKIKKTFTKQFMLSRDLQASWP